MTALVESRKTKLATALEQSEWDCFIGASGANVMYATGYISVSGQLSNRHPMAAVVTPTATRLVVPVADAAPAIDGGVPPDEVIAFGRFYFDSSDGTHVESMMADKRATVTEAILAAVEDLGMGKARIGVDTQGLGMEWAALREALPASVTVDDASAWSRQVRAQKLPEEVELLRRSARLSEIGVDRAIAAAHVGSTEKELAAIIGTTMVEGGASPRFIVVTSGPRSALADAFATDRALARGELLRFDIGCLLDGYWSDIGRTAVVGPPDELQRRRYDAIFAGEQTQIDSVKPGMAAGEVFDLAMDEVRAQGIPGYRRQHCGHGIGAEVYENPIITAGVATPLEVGMTFCFETPYYELGWGGMMVEDTLVITETGCTLLTESDRSLRVIDA
jgi:Xaa-Pro aminopeptidase